MRLYDRTLVILSEDTLSTPRKIRLSEDIEDIDNALLTQSETLETTLPVGENSISMGTIALGKWLYIKPEANDVGLILKNSIGFTGDISTGQPDILNVSSMAGLQLGQLVTGTGIPANTTIIGLSGTTVTLSNNATVTQVGQALVAEVYSQPITIRKDKVTKMWATFSAVSIVVPTTSTTVVLTIAG